MPSRELPPPPPPAHLREWLDESVVRADRARHLAELSRRGLGLRRLALLWAVAAAFALGWAFAGLAVASFEAGDAVRSLFGVVYAAFALGVLVPAGIWFVRGARRERYEHELLCAWVGAGREPVADPALRAPVRRLVWLAASLALGVCGLWVAFAAAAGSRPGVTPYGQVFGLVGLGMILWITGLLGAAKAATHHRWTARATRPAPAPAPAGRRTLSDLAA
ncbi:hypothetical protein ACFWBI_13810 [Streptomyces sp. NPDC059982]|uniref:hypothetical protein n=1 Tax=unclassified Streptomyces TaxID=2593676 RepID=UPI0036A46A93